VSEHPSGTKVDEKGCELDGDGDGILDSQDKCPDTPKGERVDATGCPFNKELLLQGVKFATNSAELLPESIPVLDRAIATLKRYPELSVEVAGIRTAVVPIRTTSSSRPGVPRRCSHTSRTAV
jgi:outer membrane protein OmpA-like peptidoglycan-associated protein